MPSSCCVPNCRSNYTKKSPKISVYQFPRDENAKRAWLSAINRENFVPTKYSKVCAKHFSDDQFATCREAFNDRTGELIQVRLEYKRLIPGAIPSLFPNSSESTNSRETLDDKAEITVPLGLKDVTVSLQEQVEKEGLEKIPAVQEPYKIFKSQKPDYLKVISNKSAIILLPLDANQESKVCELHFEADQIIRETSAFDPRTGRLLTAPLTVPRLRKGAVPSLFLPSSGPVGRTSFYQYKLANRKRKNELKVKAQKEETKATDGSELAKLLQTPPDAESQPVSEPSIAIKQEVVESVNEPPPLVIKDILCAEDLASSSNSSFSSSNLLPDLGSSPPVTNPDSTNVDESQETNVSNRPQRKRKINSVVPDADGSTSKTSRAKLHRRTKPFSPSKRNRPLPTAGTSKKSTGCFISPTKNAEDGTREKPQSSLNDFEDIPSLGSRTGGEKHRDLFDVFADFIAQKLREMNWDKCASSLRDILDIVFKAGQEQRDSEEESDISSPDSSSTSSSHED